jgi:DNA-binding NarL/FixJ family response regulator
VIKRLLVVDDDPGLLRAVAETFRAEGYEVTTARRGLEALGIIAQSLPDLIVSDIRMPGMDGYELVRNLRASARARLIPIVFLTAKDETADRIAGFQTGVDAYLTKPFEPDELVAVVTNILKRIESMRAEIASLFGRSEIVAQRPIRDEDLTDAEWRIAEAVARGLSNKEVAAEFNLSMRTVECHISRILDKKSFGNRVEIARYILDRKGTG